MNDIVEHVELLRLDASRKLVPGRKAELGQFLTPAPAARLMAAMPLYRRQSVAILDPGAGVGSLFAACVEELCQRANPPEQIHVTAADVRALVHRRITAQEFVARWRVIRYRNVFNE